MVRYQRLADPSAGTQHVVSADAAMGHGLFVRPFIWWESVADRQEPFPSEQ